MPVNIFIEMWYTMRRYKIYLFELIIDYKKVKHSSVPRKKILD